jgi:hypothetical protein
LRIVHAAFREGRAAVHGIRLEAQPQPVMLVADVHECSKGERDPDPDDGPPQRFAHRHDVRTPVEDTQIERQQRENEEKESNPDDHHGPPGAW